ncbi:MAG: Hsp20/alpha crystallin family protein [Anaerolineales bacterium]|jgi:HSP20 family protein
MDHEEQGPSLTFKSNRDDDPWGHEPLRGLGYRILRRQRGWRPPTDLIETDDSFVVLVEIAGMRGAEFKVTYAENILTIQGVRTEGHEHRAYHQMEIDFGEFISEVRLPEPVDSSEIEATYSDGFLRVVLPKSSPQTIEIED